MVRLFKQSKFSRTGSGPSLWPQSQKTRLDWFRSQSLASEPKNQTGLDFQTLIMTERSSRNQNPLYCYNIRNFRNTYFGTRQKQDCPISDDLSKPHISPAISCAEPSRSDNSEKLGGVQITPEQVFTRARHRFVNPRG